MSNEFKLNCAGKILDLNRPRVMGVLNVTPDSFYQGPLLNATEQMSRTGRIFWTSVVSRHAWSSGAPAQGRVRGFCTIEGLASRFNVVLSIVPLSFGDEEAVKTRRDY